jgi:hypothetical protein
MFDTAWMFKKEDKKVSCGIILKFFGFILCSSVIEDNEKINKSKTF